MSDKKPDTPKLFHNHLDGWIRYMTPNKRMVILIAVWAIIAISPLNRVISDLQFVIGLVVWFIIGIFTNRKYRRAMARWLPSEMPWTVAEFKEVFSQVYVLSDFLPFGPDLTNRTVHVRFMEHPDEEFVVTDPPTDIRAGERVTLEYRKARYGRNEVRNVISLG